MDLTRDFIEKIQEMENGPKIVRDELGMEYGVGKLNPILPSHIVPVQVETLTGLLEYINTVHDIPGEGTFLHIEQYNTVSFKGALDGLLFREKYASAEINHKSFSFGSYMDHESFIVGVQSFFVEDGVRATVLQMVGNISAGAVQINEDDGISQKVTVKSGIQRLSNAVVPNPVRLRPYRTFDEIEQPASSYVLRIREVENKIPVCALFETASSRWESEAKESIKKWLRQAGVTLPIIG